MLLKSKESHVFEGIKVAFTKTTANIQTSWTCRCPLTEPGGEFNLIGEPRAWSSANTWLHSSRTRQVVSNTEQHSHRTHIRTAGNETNRAGSNRMETSTLPLLQQHQSDTGGRRRQATVGRTWGMGWRWACRIREVVEDALAGPLKVKCCVHPIWLRWTNVQSGLGAGRLLPQSRMRVRAAGVAGKGTRKLNTERS